MPLQAHTGTGALQVQSKSPAKQVELKNCGEEVLIAE